MGKRPRRTSTVPPLRVWGLVNDGGGRGDQLERCSGVGPCRLERVCIALKRVCIALKLHHVVIVLYILCIYKKVIILINELEIPYFLLGQRKEARERVQ